MQNPNQSMPSQKNDKLSFLNRLMSSSSILLLSIIVFIAALVFLLIKGSSVGEILKILIIPLLGGLGALVKSNAENYQKHLYEIDRKHLDFQNSLQLEQHKHEKNLILQQQQFLHSLTIDKKTKVVEEVLWKIEKLSSAGKFSRNKRSLAEIMEVRQLFYKVIIYFDDAVLLDCFQKVFIACFEGNVVEVRNQRNLIMDGFRRKLHSFSYSKIDERLNNVRIEFYLANLAKGYLDIKTDATLWPIQVVSKRKDNHNQHKWKWLEMRLSSLTTIQELYELCDKRTAKSSLQHIKTNDILVFWSNRYGQKLDGVLGVIWVKKKMGSYLQLGRRITVSHDYVATFDSIQNIPNLQEKTSAPSVENTEEQPNQPQHITIANFENSIRTNSPVHYNVINHFIADGFGACIDLLAKKKRKIDLDISLPGKLRRHNGKLILCIKLEYFLKVVNLATWLHHFVYWQSLGEFTFILNGIEHFAYDFRLIRDLEEIKNSLSRPFRNSTELSGNYTNYLINVDYLDPSDLDGLAMGFMYIELTSTDTEISISYQEDIFGSLVSTTNYVDVELKFLTKEVPYSMEIQYGD